MVDVYKPFYEMTDEELKECTEKIKREYEQIGVLNSALAFFRNGKPVIPISETKKRPMIKFTTEPLDTEEKIIRFWKNNPKANLAVQTTDILVVDVDRHTKTENGFKTLKELNHPEWFNTMAYTTGNDSTSGIHYVFEKPKRFDEQIISAQTGIDVKGQHNNYSIMPPSCFNRKQYSWLNYKGIAPIPQGLLDFCLGKKVKETDKKESYKRFNNGQTAFATYAPMLVNGLGSGTKRYINLKSMTEYMLGKGGLEPSTAFEMAEKANQATSDALSQGELETIFKNCLETNRTFVFDGSTALSRYSEVLLNGLGEEGSRNDTLYKFVSYMLGYGNVALNDAYLLAEMVNQNTFTPLPQKEFESTFRSSLKRSSLERKKEK